LYGLHTLMEKERPDTVFVQGDTTTAAIAALTAYYGYDYYVRNDAPEGKRHLINIAHVEAGLRTGDNYAPFPEEVNRKLIGQMATHHFAPTLIAATALYDENITANVHITGNTGIDALFDAVSMLQQTPRNPLPQLPLEQQFVLITGHRRENYGDGFLHICKAIRTLAEQFPHVAFVYPVHPNQHVQGPVKEHLSNVGNIVLCEPLDYPDFIALMQRCTLVLTDSGGLQEEAPSLGKPVLVMRDVTERPDAVLAGTARMVGTDATKIVANVSELLTNPAAYKKMADAINPYGDGHACQRILNIMAGENAAENMFQPVAA
ncbi:MAG: UDP-N-acetylglucosamine 2-epimerase (non-hydrolyzing), partial [Alphaproteobacteria bacterium]